MTKLAIEVQNLLDEKELDLKNMSIYDYSDTKYGMGLYEAKESSLEEFISDLKRILEKERNE